MGMTTPMTSIGSKDTEKREWVVILCTTWPGTGTGMRRTACACSRPWHCACPRQLSALLQVAHAQRRATHQTAVDQVAIPKNRVQSVRPTKLRMAGAASGDRTP